MQAKGRHGHDHQHRRTHPKRSVAYFRADLCLSDPDNYTLDEKREICEQMESTSKAIEDAMKADFESLPPELRIRLLDMLCVSGVEGEWFWKELLIGEMPDSAEEISAGFGAKMIERQQYSEKMTLAP